MQIMFEADLCYPYPTLDVLSGPLTEVSVAVPHEARVWEVEEAKGGYTFQQHGKAINMPWNALILRDNTLVEVQNHGDLRPSLFLVHRLDLSRNPRWMAFVEVYALGSSMDDRHELKEEIRAALESGQGRSLSFYVPRSVMS